jgi:hypothetical protein
MNRGDGSERVKEVGHLHPGRPRRRQEDQSQLKPTGTNGGPLPLPTGELLPATNKHVDVRGAWFGIVDRDGRIKTQREYFDQFAVLQQLGLVPAEQAATRAEASTAQTPRA